MGALFLVIDRMGVFSRTNFRLYRTGNLGQRLPSARGFSICREIIA